MAQDNIHIWRLRCSFSTDLSKLLEELYINDRDSFCIYKYILTYIVHYLHRSTAESNIIK